MIKQVVTNFLGTKFERDVRKIQPTVDEILRYEERLSDVSEEQLQAQTEKFRAIIRERTQALEDEIAQLKETKKRTESADERERMTLRIGQLERELQETTQELLDELLPEAYATVREACRRLLGRARGESDPYAPLAGRWALLGFLLTNGFMIWWSVRAGMSWWSFAVLIGLFYAVLLGASRLVAAGGVMYVDTGYFPRWVTLRTIGALPIGPTSLTMYAYLSVIYMYDPMNLAMPQMMNSFKLVHSGRLRGSSFTLGAVLALVAVTGFGLVALLRMLHQHGASSLAAWPFTSYPRWAFGELDATLRSPEVPDNWLRLAVGTGAAFTLLLVWLHSRFVWWPVSPVGFLIASSYETNRSMWMNVFIAWALSTLIRRYGGLRLFRTLRPAFLGLVLGQYLTQGALAIISSIFGITQPLG